MRIALSVPAFGLVLYAGCATSSTAAVRQVNFVDSSLDFNQKTVHSAKVPETDLSTVVKKITVLAEKRNLVLVSSNCRDVACEFILKRNPDTVTKTVRSYDNPGERGRLRTTTILFSSRFFGRIAPSTGGTVVEMVGVPVINDGMACPSVLEQQSLCTPKPFNVPDGKTPAQSFRTIWGVDISGQLEADAITGILAELP